MNVGMYGRRFGNESYGREAKKVDKHQVCKKSRDNHHIRLTNI